MMAGGANNIKAYGTYEEVYADKVLQFSSTIFIQLILMQNVDAVYIGEWHL